MCVVDSGMSAGARERVEKAKLRLKDAFQKSKSSFLEEADSILSKTIEPGPSHYHTPHRGG